ncbi:MAG: hypothetical protein JNL10_12130 [Verrucomicrobiales bacterium]|nr:hypothetical protein [Verrucomicrobiales bacterium]
MNCSYTLLPALVAALLLNLTPGLARAGEDATPAASASASSGEKKGATRSNVPFRGHVGSVDASAGTVTLAGKKKDRVLHVNDQSLLERAGKPAAIGDIRPGDYARGLISRETNGKEVLLKATFGDTPAESAGSPGRSRETASSGK